MNEKKNRSCTSLCSPKSISQHSWSLFFQLQCQQNTSSPAPPRPAYPLESLSGLHLFTKALAWKLYKHSYTIKKGVLCNWCQPMLRPKCNNFHGLELEKFPPAYSLMQTQTVTYTIRTHIPSAFSCCLLTSALITKCEGHKCAVWPTSFSTSILNRQHVVIFMGIICSSLSHCNSSDLWGKWAN